jgi:hypothetical protein
MVLRFNELRPSDSGVDDVIFALGTGVHGTSIALTWLRVMYGSPVDFPTPWAMRDVIPFSIVKRCAELHLANLVEGLLQLSNLGLQFTICLGQFHDLTLEVKDLTVEFHIA